MIWQFRIREDELQQNERAGVVFALVGFMTFTLADSLFKLVSHEWAPTALGAFRYSVGAIGLGAILWWREGAAGFRVRQPWVQLMRSVGMAMGTACWIAALRYMPLIDATAIIFTSPMLTALIAAIALREPVTRQTWFATGMGFVGVIIVVRPSFTELGLVAILPLFTALGMSMLVIGNRLSAKAGSPLAMQFQVAAPAALFLVAMALLGHFSDMPMLHIGEPTAFVLAVCGIIAVTASTGHWLVYLGTTRAGASTVAPMSYAEIIVAGMLGWLMFGERPDLTALAGVAIIVASGLYLWHVKRPVALPDEAG